MKKMEIAQKISWKCLSAVVIWEMHIKTLLRFLIMPDRKANIKKTQQTGNVRRVKGKCNIHSLLVDLLNYKTLQNSVDNFQKVDSKSSIWSNCTTACNIPKGSK